MTCPVDVSSYKSGRSFELSVSERVLQDAESLNRFWNHGWYLYIQNRCRIISRFCCKILRSENNCLFVSKPFNASWRLNPCLFDHENSEVHRECLNKWYEPTLRLHIHQTVDKRIQDTMDKEGKKWRAIIHIIIDVILFPSKIFSWP